MEALRSHFLVQERHLPDKSATYTPFKKSEKEAAHSRPTLGDPKDWGPPGSSVHEIFQARILEWVAIPSPGNSLGLRISEYGLR